MIRETEQLKSSVKEKWNIVGELEIDETTWSKIFDEASGKFFNRIWTSPFIAAMTKETGCIVNFKGNDILPKGSKVVKSISLRGYCKHENCRSYRLEWIPDRSVSSKKFSIKSNQTEKNHPTQLTGWCNGLARQELKEKSLGAYPKGLFNEKMNSIDMSLVKKENNLQGLLSYDSYRKVRSEKLNENRGAIDDVADVKLMRQKSIQNKEDQYIHEILDPFGVYLYSQAQFNILKQEIKKRSDEFEVVMHIDSTGAVVRKPCESCNQLMYYAGIIKTKSAEYNNNNDYFPVFEMISSSHDVVAIGNWLRTTKERLGILEPWLDRVVTDMSFATINSLCDIFNHQSFIEYLNLTHKWMMNMDLFRNEKKSKTIISLCTSHLMKNLTRDIKNACKEEIVAKHIIEIFSSLFNIPSYELMRSVWRKLCVLLLSPIFTATVEKTLNLLVLTVTTEYKYDVKEVKLIESY